MKKSQSNTNVSGFFRMALLMAAILLVATSCNKDDLVIDNPPDNSAADGYENYLFWGAIPFDTDNNYYHTLALGTDHLGTRTFIFGQDSYDDHYWFVQEITSNGHLGAETDNGHWNNYYKSAPRYM